MTTREAKAPIKTIILDYLIDKMAAMRNVLSPISEKMIIEKLLQRALGSARLEAMRPPRMGTQAAAADEADPESDSPSATSIGAEAMLEMKGCRSFAGVLLSSQEGSCERERSR